MLERSGPRDVPARSGLLQSGTRKECLNPSLRSCPLRPGGPDRFAQTPPKPCGSVRKPSLMHPWAARSSEFGQRERSFVQIPAAGRSAIGNHLLRTVSGMAIGLPVRGGSETRRRRSGFLGAAQRALPVGKRRRPGPQHLQTDEKDTLFHGGSDPYLDRHGEDLAKGRRHALSGLGGNSDRAGAFLACCPKTGWRGSVVTTRPDLVKDGRSFLEIRPLLWSADGWPVPGENVLDGTYQIRSQQTGTVLQAPGGSAHSRLVQTARYLIRDNQKWTVTACGGGLFKIASGGPRKCVNAGRTAGGRGGWRRCDGTLFGSGEPALED